MTTAVECSVIVIFLRICLTIGYTPRFYSEVDITVPFQGKGYTAFYEGKYARYISSIEIVSGVLVPADDDFGCPSNNTSVFLPNQPFILLLKLTRCNDYEQSALAQALGARGVVFHSASGQLSSMTTGGDLSITVTIIDLENTVLADLKGLPHGAKPTVVISPLQRSTQASPHFYFIVVSIAALAAIFGSWFTVTLARRWWVNARTSRLREQARRERESVIKRLVSRTYTTPEPDDQSEHPICAVCLESFKHPDIIRVLGCSHEFHQKCVDPWLKLKMTCPLCKHSLATIEEEAPPPLREAEGRERRRGNSATHEDEVPIFPVII